MNDCYELLKQREAAIHMLASINLKLLRMTHPKADALYEDRILHYVGEIGLMAMRQAKVIESCGVIEGHKLYTI